MPGVSDEAALLERLGGLVFWVEGSGDLWHVRGVRGPWIEGLCRGIGRCPECRIKGAGAMQRVSVAFSSRG